MTDRPCSAARFDVLAQDCHWRRLVHEVLLDVVHAFRALVARWSALLLATEESRRALTDLAAQVEEFSDVFVAIDGRKSSEYVAERLDEHRDLWRRAFANAVAMEEKLIDLGGERRTTGGRFTTPGRHLLPAADLARIEARDTEPTPSTWRLYDPGNAASPAAD